MLYQTKTDEEGHFCWRNIPPARYALKAWKEGCSSCIPIAAEVRPKSRSDVKLTLEAGWDYEGIVFSESGEVAVGRDVELEIRDRQEGRLKRDCRTDDNGRFRFAIWHPDRTSAFVRCGAYHQRASDLLDLPTVIQIGQQSAVESPRAPDELQLTSEELAQVDTLEAATLVVEVPAHLRATADGVGFWILDDSWQGFHDFDLLPLSLSNGRGSVSVQPGTHRYRMVVGSHCAQVGEFEARPLETTRIFYDPTPPKTISLVIRNSVGDPVSDAEILLFSDMSPDYMEQQTNSSGESHFEICKDNFSLMVTREEYWPLFTELNFTTAPTDWGDETLDWRQPAFSFTLWSKSEVCTATIHVRAPETSEPVVGKIVCVHVSSNSQTQRVVTEGSPVQLTGLAPGRHQFALFAVESEQHAIVRADLTPGVETQLEVQLEEAP